MSSVIRDLLPNEVDVSSTAMPSEILEFQARRLEERTKGVLRATILRSDLPSEVLLSFELIAPALDVTTILFKVRHRPGFELPAVIVPPEPLPTFLRPTLTVKKVKKGLLMAPMLFDSQEEISEPNDWLAVSADEFENKVGEVLQLPQIRAVFANLISRSNRIVDESASSSGDSNV